MDILFSLSTEVLLIGLATILALAVFMAFRLIDILADKSLTKKKSIEVIRMRRGQVESSIKTMKIRKTDIKTNP